MSNHESSVELAWEARGPLAAPAVLLLHSLGTDRSLWDDQVSALEPRCRVLLVDLRGHGKSPAPVGPYTIAELALDVLAVMDRAEVELFDCVGSSLGGMIAQWLAVYRPARVKRLVIANSAARIGTEQSWQDRIRALHAFGMSGLCQGVLSRWFVPQLSATHPERVMHFANVFRETSAVGYAGCCAALAVADLRSVISAIGVPTLVIAGDLDAATPTNDALWLQRKIRGSSLRMLEHAAHLSNIDQPERFNECVTGFLDGTLR